MDLTPAHREIVTERLLLHNRALAKLALGRVAEGKAEMTHVLELWQRDTGPGQRQATVYGADETEVRRVGQNGEVRCFGKCLQVLFDLVCGHFPLVMSFAMVCSCIFEVPS